MKASTALHLRDLGIVTGAVGLCKATGLEDDVTTGVVLFVVGTVARVVFGAYADAKEVVEADRLRGVLRWYADPANYSFGEVAEVQCGGRARRAIYGDPS